jgi:hypothetical protein
VTKDRRPYLTATALTQSFLNEASDNLVNQLELIVEITVPTGVDTPSGLIRASDRNKYVGGNFYEARLVFPTIIRTMGDWLSNVLEFSTIDLEINNVDGKYNSILPAGNHYDGFIGNAVRVAIGLRDVESTYTDIFRGRITAEGGVKRTTNSIIFTARNDFENINVNFPKGVLKLSTYPDMEPDIENTVLPEIYGDWTVNVDGRGASVPAYVVNGADTDVNGEVGYTEKVQLVISVNANTVFDTNNVYLVRGDQFYKFDAADVVDVSVAKNTFNLRQSGTSPAGTTQVDGANFEYATGDLILVRVKGKDLGAYSDNAVWIARDLLLTHSSLVPGDFDTSWEFFRDKNSPAQSNVAAVKARAWIQEPQPLLEYVLSLLEQVRLEAYVNRDQIWTMTSLHFEDFVDAPSFELKNWDIEKGSFKPEIDDRNNFNRAVADYNFLPNLNESNNSTKVYKNNAAIIQAGKEISKKVVFPNLYVESDVVYQLKEVLRLASSYFEKLTFNMTWRGLLLDLGGFVNVNVKIQGTQYNDVPAMIRSIGYDPAGIKIPVELWSFQLTNFPGYEPGFSGIVGGYNAVITEE